MKHIAALLISLSFSLVTCFASEEADKQLPKAMEPILARLNSARNEAATKAIKELQKLQGELTKKSDLEGAMATKKYIEGLQKSIKDNKEIATNDLLGNSLDDPIIGKWGDKINVMWDFKADGTGNHYWGGANFSYQWTHTDAGYSVVITGRASRVLIFVDKNTINIEPGNSVRMK